MKALYESGWQHPGIAIVGALAFAIALAWRRPTLLALVTVFGFEIVADAVFTGALSPAIGTSLMTPVGITFVILGDLRFFAAIELFATPRAEPRGLGPVGAWLRAVPWAFVVPVASTVPQLVWPAWFTISNRIFLVYEAMFLVLALGLRFVVLPRRLASQQAPVRAWLLGLATFEIVQYAAWVVCDVLILSGVELAYLARMIPNTLYYALFLPFLFFTAPCDLRAEG